MKKGIGIKGKLMAFIVPTSLIVFIIATFLLIGSAESTILKRSKEVLSVENAKCTEAIQSSIDNILTETEILHQTIEVNNMTDEEILNFLAYTMTVDEAFSAGLYLGDKNNKYLDAGWVPDADYITYERDWYKAGIDKDVMTFGDAYLDDLTGELCLSASARLKSRDADKMVVAADIYLSGISQMVSEYRIMEGGSCFLVNNSETDKLILAHANPELLGVDITTLDNSCVEGALVPYLQNADGSIFNVECATGKYYAVANKLNGVDWILVSVVPENDIMGAVRKMGTMAMISIIIIAVIIIVILRIIISKITGPILALTDSIDKMTDGDFTIDIPITTKDEIGVMSKKLGDFVTHMREMFSEMGSISSELINQADNSSGISGDLYESADMQSTSMNELSTTVEQLSISIDEVANSATDLVQVVNATADNGLLVDEKMTSTSESTERGRVGMEKVADAVKSNEEQMISLQETVLKVGKAIEEINGIAEQIGEISSQTNLLSLNASIESARAGEAGRGFAVVADEIRKLADTSEESTAEIKNITSEISVLVSEVTEKTTHGVEQMKECNRLVDISSQDFEDISVNVLETKRIVNQMVDDVRKVNDMAANVAAIAEEQAASTTEISSTADVLKDLSISLSDNSKTVAGAADTISDTADVLADHMKKFIY